MGGDTGAIRTADDLLQPLRAMAKGRCLGPASRSRIQSLRRRHRHDRLVLCSRSPARGHGKKGDGNNGGMGRSRGGLTSKIHALVDAEGRPVTLRLTGGQVADCKEAEALLDALGEGDILLADKGYDSNAIRVMAAKRKAWANIPPKANRKGSFAFSAWVYRQRNLVERFFNRIKHFRGIATRYDKDPANYLAAVKLVATRIWCQP